VKVVAVEAPDDVDTLARVRCSVQVVVVVGGGRVAREEAPGPRVARQGAPGAPGPRVARPKR
jgi:hypothetical protein